MRKVAKAPLPLLTFCKHFFGEFSRAAAFSQKLSYVS